MVIPCVHMMERLALRRSQEGGLDDGPSGAREPIYNIDGLHEKLEDIGWAMEAPWEETLIITDNNEEQVDNVEDDLERELAFYNQVSNPP
jgi:hypothetical protein